MKKILIAATLISCSFLYACSNSNSDNQSGATLDLTQTTNTVIDTAQNIVENAITNLEENANEIKEEVITIAENVVPANKPKLNPPHGEPGHVCEIPVGAPLDGSAAQPQVQIQPVTATQPQITPTAPTTQNTNSPRLNPPHGEPGHVCEIPVGAPLDQ